MRTAQHAESNIYGHEDREEKELIIKQILLVSTKKKCLRGCVEKHMLM